MKNKELIKLSEYQKSLVYFSTSLKSNDFLLQRLKKMKSFIKTNKEEDLIEDALDENKQAIEMTTIYSKVLTGIMNTFASVISNNLNSVMKTLTSITIILMLPTLVASIYGMNIPLPFQGSVHAFTITMIMSLILSFIGVMFFWRRELF